MHPSEIQVAFQGSAGEQQLSAPKLLNQGFSADNFVPPRWHLAHSRDIIIMMVVLLATGIGGQETAGTLQHMAVATANVGNAAAGWVSQFQLSAVVFNSPFNHLE